ncbi:MAG: AAA family ATPase [Planctomycetota bacterium]|nr:AAA family ATPase [Planctomycetota bacterium]
MLLHLGLKNFRSLKHVNIKFTSPMSVIIGANNTGKSSILQAINMLHAFSIGRLSEVFSGLNGIDLIKSIGLDSPIEFFVILEGHSQNGYAVQFEYRLEVTMQDITGLTVRSEELLRRISDGTVEQLLNRAPGQSHWTYLDEASQKSESYHGDPTTHALPHLQDRIKNRHIQEFKALLSSGWVMDIQPRNMRTISPVRPNTMISWDGSNLATVLDGLLGEHPEAFYQWKKDLARLAPEIKEVLLRSTDDGKKYVVFRENNLTEPISIFQASDGLLRIMAILAALHSSWKPNLLAIEEPENGIHPRRLEQVVDLLRSYSEGTTDGIRRQVIITTHSPYLIDEVHPDEIFLTSKDETGVSIRPIEDKALLEKLLEDATLGEIWHRGSVGGVPTL